MGNVALQMSLETGCHYGSQSLLSVLVKLPLSLLNAVPLLLPLVNDKTLLDNVEKLLVEQICLELWPGSWVDGVVVIKQVN